MNRHALYLMLAAAALLCSCQSGRVRIEGRIVGADDPPFDAHTARLAGAQQGRGREHEIQRVSVHGIHGLGMQK